MDEIGIVIRIIPYCPFLTISQKAAQSRSRKVIYSNTDAIDKDRNNQNNFQRFEEAL